MNATFRIKVLGARKLPGNKEPNVFATLRLGDQSFRTSVVKASSAPSWDDAVFDFVIAPVLLDATLSVLIYAKGFIKNELLGQATFLVYELVQDGTDLHLFDDPEFNRPAWYPLMKAQRGGSMEAQQQQQDATLADVRLKMGFVTNLSKDFLSLFNSFKERLAPMNATLIRAGIEDEEDSETSLVEGGDGSQELMGSSMAFQASHDAIQSGTGAATASSSELKGLLTVDIINATDLPHHSQPGRFLSRCDPFVTLSFGPKTFRTRVIRDTKNPTFNERVNLYVKQSDYEADWTLKFSVFDYESLSHNENMGSVMMSIQEMVERSIQSEHQPNEPLAFVPVTVELSLKGQTPSKSDEMLPETPGAKLFIHCKFIPYQDIRRNFWIQMCRSFDSDASNSVNRIELTTLLDALGSTYTEETIDMIFISQGVSPETDQLAYDRVFEAIESKLHDTMELTAKLLQETSISRRAFQTSHMERLFQIKNCPMCRKNLSNKMDMDVIAHIALCKLDDPSKLDNFVLGGFLTESYASRKWYTKIINRVTFGKYSTGKNNANIICQDRATGQLVEEKMPTYIRLGIRLMYQLAGSRTLVETKAIKRLLESMSVKQGQKFDDPSSKAQIAHFASFHKLSLDESEPYCSCLNICNISYSDVKVLEPLDSFKTFNEFFYRKLKPDARRLASADTKVAVSPADCRLTCFPTVDSCTELWIKGSQFTIGKLLQDEELASEFEGGAVGIFRLSPQDYHRFHFPVDGEVMNVTRISGTYFTVNPMAVRTPVDVYTENVRTVTLIESTDFGKVVMVCVGAMMVGSIIMTKESGHVSRMEEHGYFAFGGSTILILFQKDRILFDRDLVENSDKCVETIVKVGNSIGMTESLSPTEDTAP